MWVDVAFSQSDVSPKNTNSIGCCFDSNMGSMTFLIFSFICREINEVPLVSFCDGSIGTYESQFFLVDI